MTAPPLLALHGVCKRYGAVEVLVDIELEIQAGQVVGLLGDNGAGKSTLVKCLSGVEQPDSGEILIDGRKVVLDSPTAARAHGIETAYQDLAVAPDLDIADNLFLGREPRAPGIMGSLFRKLDRGRMRAEASKQMNELGIMTIQDITQQVESLSGGQRQGVAVARSAAFARHVVIMDEPTAALGVKESHMVLDLIRQVRDRGLPVILISHNMPHVFEVADRIHIQRLGRRIAVINPKDVSSSDGVAIMTGAMDPEGVPSALRREAASTES